MMILLTFAFFIYAILCLSRGRVVWDKRTRIVMFAFAIHIIFWMSVALVIYGMLPWWVVIVVIGVVPMSIMGSKIKGLRP